ncbi:hypothetical protein KA017_01070 [Candidatus Woesebacteria bacterium]|nr:hypothetical protein [Candidatus Woesebacteria bacterium]
MIKTVERGKNTGGGIDMTWLGINFGHISKDTFYSDNNLTIVKNMVAAFILDWTHHGLLTVPKEKLIAEARFTQLPSGKAIMGVICQEGTNEELIVFAIILHKDGHIEQSAKYLPGGMITGTAPKITVQDIEAAVVRLRTKENS